MRKIFFLLLVLLVCFYPLLHAQPANAVKRYDAGLKFYNDKKYQQALGELDEAISIYPSYTLAYYTRGNALYALKNYEEALIYYKECLEIREKVLGKQHQDYILSLLGLGNVVSN